MRETDISLKADFRIRIPAAVDYSDKYAVVTDDGTVLNEMELVSDIHERWAESVRDEFEGIEFSHRLPSMDVEMKRCEDADGGFGEFYITLNAESRLPVISDTPEEVEGDLLYALENCIKKTAKAKGWTVCDIDVDAA